MPDNVLTVADNLTTVKLPDGREFKIDLVEAAIRAGEINLACKGREDFEHLELFSKWLKDEAGVTFELKRSWVDGIYTKVQLQYATLKKKDLLDAVSPSSTASTPGS